ncbi:hypothetical protein [Streptomyces griseoluteus]|uniref:hypothetical protein n=1 Tax=Streptomyces griseoluteus TaxID=29306 RepID=UPI003702C98D
MLAQLPLVYVLLMAAFATFLFCFALQRWMRTRKLAWVSLVVSIGCCLGMVGVGGLQRQHWSAQQMLVMYSFVWTGLAIGLFPSRKFFRQLADEARRGVRREDFEYPARYGWFVCFSVVVMCFLAFLLAT